MIDHWKAKGLDFSGIFYKPEADRAQIHWTQRQKHPIDDVLDRKLIAKAKPAIETGEPVRIEMPIGNVDRSVGAMLSGEVAKRHGHGGLQDDTIAVSLHRNGRAELRRVPGARHFLRPEGRRQRLCRQGPVGRAHRRAPAGECADQGRMNRSSSATR